MRTLLTVGGVACAMLMLLLVESLGAGLDRALSGSDTSRTLIVYRKNRYCPQTSFLPEWYGPRIEQLDGVESVPAVILVGGEIGFFMMPELPWGCFIPASSTRRSGCARCPATR